MSGAIFGDNRTKLDSAMRMRPEILTGDLRSRISESALARGRLCWQCFVSAEVGCVK
jgi:hypothetical protein